MITPSWRFQLRHPYLSVLVVLSNPVIVCLLMWGWIALRFSPVQRHYLPAYVQSSVGVLAGKGPEYVQWIEKKAPGKEWEIAQPEDLVPAKGGVAPFQLSQAARAEGWNDLGFSTNSKFQERDIRDYLQENFFDGRSLLFLVLQPFEVILIGFLCWKAFDDWRKDLARERGAGWDPHYRPTRWDEDLALFTKVLYGEARTGAVQGWRWLASKQKSMDQPAVVAVGSATVSPSRNGEPAPPIPSMPKPKAATPAAAKAIEAAPVRSPRPAAPMANPSQPPALKSQPLAQPDPKPGPISPFGKPAAEGQPERKWDISQWID